MHSESWWSIPVARRCISSTACHPLRVLALENQPGLHYLHPYHFLVRIETTAFLCFPAVPTPSGLFLPVIPYQDHLLLLNNWRFCPSLNLLFVTFAGANTSVETWNARSGYI
jgi:hypothetical protein